MLNKQWVFLSHELTETTPSYGNRGGFLRELTSSLKEGKSSNSERWSFPNHIGTHVDVSRHFFDEGESVDSFPADFWVCSSTLLLDCEVPDSLLIGPTEVQRGLETFSSNCSEVDCLLIRTGFEKLRGTSSYWEANPGLQPELADWLRREMPKVRFLGIDVLSVTSWRHRELGRAVHQSFLKPGASISLIEDMKLSLVPAEALIDELVILPMRVQGADGGPATVIARVHC